MPPRRVRPTLGRAWPLVLAGLVGPAIGTAQEVTSITLNAAAPCDNKPPGRVNLSGPAAAGVVVLLTSNLPASASVPARVPVPPGANSVSFQLACAASTQAIAVTLKASVQGGTGVATAVVSVPAAVLSSVTVGPHTGGPSVSGQVFLVAPAPPGGVVVTLSSNSNDALVPPSVTVPGGAATATFTVTARPVAEPTQVSILATGLGVSKIATLALVPPRPAGISCDDKAGSTVLVATKSVEGSASVLGRVELSSPSPTNGFPVTLSSSHPSVTFSETTPGASATGALVLRFEASTSRKTFEMHASPVGQPAAVTISASSGGVNRTCVLTVLPPALGTFTLTPGTVVGGQSAQARVSLSSPAPAGGIVIQLSNSHSNLAMAPTTVTVPAGSQDLSFPILTQGLEQRANVRLTATAGSVTKSVELEVAPKGPSSLRIVPGSVIGGIETKGEVDAVPQDAFVVELASNHPGVASVPGSVSFGQGTTRQSFPITTKPVAQNTRVEITATTTATGQPTTVSRIGGAVVRSFFLEVLAPVVTAISLDQTFVVAPATATGRVTITGPAPVGGLPVRIGRVQGGLFLSDDMRVPAGATSAPFTMYIAGVSATVGVLVKAVTGNVERTIALEVRRP